MSKRTLDAFLVAPAAATAKRTKKRSNVGSSAASRATPKPKARGLDVVEVVDLDEVIDLSSPPPETHGTLLDANTGGKPEAEVVETDASGPNGNTDGEGDPGSTHATASRPADTHAHYPFPIPRLNSPLSRTISASPIKEPKILNHLPHLDLLSFEPYMGTKDAREYGEFLRRELPFYRVEYKLTRFGKETDIKTPRFTVSSRRLNVPHTCSDGVFQTVFGVDDTSRFTTDGNLIETSTGKPIAKNKYKTAKPRPIPSCLDELRKASRRTDTKRGNMSLSLAPIATSAERRSRHRHHLQLRARQLLRHGLRLDILPLGRRAFPRKGARYRKFQFSRRA